jgi:hypothetical protein
MKLGRKNKIEIFALALVIGLITYSAISNNSLSPWERSLTIASWIMFAALNIRRIIIVDKDFSLHEDILTIRRTFLKEKMYDLKSIKGWAEYHNSLFGAFASRTIVLKIQKQGVNLSDKNNAIEFDRLLDYLNENFAEINEN